MIAFGEKRSIHGKGRQRNLVSSLFSRGVAGGYRAVAVLKHFIGAGDSKVVRDATKIAENLFLFDIERLENDGAAGHVDIEKNLVPVIFRHFLLDHLERSALVQMAK